MANRERGAVSVEIGGERYTMRFGINECCDLEDTFDKTIVEIGGLLGGGDNLGMREIRSMFRIAVSEGHPDLTDRQAGEIMQKSGNVTDVVAKIAQAFEAAFPDAEGDVEQDPPKGAAAKAGSGTNS